MTTIKRKILFFLFVAAFLVMTPYIMLYASGYQLDLRHPFSPLMVQKTGMAIIYSDPDQANIFLNDKRQKSLSFSFNPDKTAIKTPAKIKNPLPGSYDLRVELPGYWSWQRRIKIHPGQITHVLDVNLFRKDLPVLLADSTDHRLYPSPNLKKTLIGGSLVDLKDENVENIFASSGQTVWSGNSERVIVGDLVITPKDGDRTLDLSKIIGDKISDLKWADDDQNKIIYRHNKTLNSFDLSKSINSVIADDEEVLDYLPKDDHIFYVAQNGFSAKLKTYSLSDGKATKESDLPPSDGYVFLEGKNGLLNLYDSKYKILYLIDPEASVNPLLEIINNAKYFQWYDDETLFFANDSEIWLLDMKNDSRRLLLRWSEPLKGIVKTKKDNYLFFHTENSLKVLTWDKGDEKLQVTEFLKLDRVSSLFLSENENTLYFAGKIGNQEGLYKLNIK